MSQRAAQNSESAVGLREYQERIGRFARMIFIISGAFLVLSLVVSVVLPREGRDFAGHGNVVHGGTLILCGGVWGWSCVPTLPRRLLLVLDAGLTIALGAAWMMLGTAAPVTEPIEYTVLLASTYTVFARSVIVPSSFLRTLWITALTMAPTAGFFYWRGFQFITGLDPQSRRTGLLFAALWCLTAILVSALNSRRIYGLREQVRELGKLGQYTLANKIGAGGMGVVYRAHHAMLRRPAAIKLLLPDLASEADLARFEREVQLTAQLSHPNTISIFDYGRSADGAVYYVMEYLDGIDLEQLVESEGPLLAPRVVRILAQVCGSLAEAHAQGLIHRDIKPANLILTERADEPDIIKVVDFGLVRPIDEGEGKLDITTAGAITGTPRFLSPEAITDNSSVDARSDIYAVGATAYYLLTGKHVFSGKTVIEVCTKHIMEQPVRPSVWLEKLAPDLEGLILACLAKKREDRPASAAELRAQLLACVDADAYDDVTARRWWAARRGRPLPPKREAPVHESALGATIMIRPVARNPS